MQRCKRVQFKSKYSSLFAFADVCYSVCERARIFVDLLEADTGVPRDCWPAAMNDRVGWRKTTGRQGRGGGWGEGGGSTEVDLVVVVVAVVYNDLISVQVTLNNCYQDFLNNRLSIG